MFLYLCEVFEISVRALFNIISNCDNGFAVTQFISCYVIAHYGQKSKAVGCLTLITQRPMYTVFISTEKKNERVVIARVERVEPALMFALELHRVIALPHLISVIDSSNSLVVALSAENSQDAEVSR